MAAAKKCYCCKNYILEGIIHGTNSFDEFKGIKISAKANHI